MGTRTTKDDLKSMAERVNRELRGSGNKVLIGSRYGYTAIDIGNENRTSIRETLRSGLTKSQAYDMLYGMARALEMKSESKRKLRGVC